jgi:MFS family permease
MIESTVYGVSFYRLRFSILPAVGGMFAAVAALSGMVGGAGGGRLINRCGRKTITVVAAFAAGLFTLLFTFMPNVWVSLAFYAGSAFTISMMMAALNSLVLEQIPEFRPSMMSINTMFAGIGGLFGVPIGGLLLNLYANNFQILMLFIGSAGVASAAVVLLFARDPCKTRLPSQSTA